MYNKYLVLYLKWIFINVKLILHKFLIKDKNVANNNTHFTKDKFVLVIDDDIQDIQETEDLSPPSSPDFQNSDDLRSDFHKDDQQKTIGPDFQKSNDQQKTIGDMTDTTDTATSTTTQS